MPAIVFRLWRYDKSGSLNKNPNDKVVQKIRHWKVSRGIYEMSSTIEYTSGLSM
jgi:hypothetical protein